jgi:tRNA (guanine-N7-)-methyltransferase
MHFDLAPLRPDFWQEIFGNANPIAVEIGPGLGEFLITAAVRRRDRNFFAIERSSSRAAHIEQRLLDKRLTNARVLRGDATCVLTILPDACVGTYYVQFPDPWWKRRHYRRRLMTGSFVAELRRTLRPGGTIELITDVEEYYELAVAALDADTGLELLSTDLDLMTATSFSRKAHQRGWHLRACIYLKPTPD